MSQTFVRYAPTRAIEGMKLADSSKYVELITVVLVLSLGVCMTSQRQQAGLVRHMDSEASVLQSASDQSAQGENPRVNAEEKKRLRRAEEAAGRFVQRWHETLDLHVLFEEMYVSNAEQRRHNARLFYAAYKFMSQSGYDPAVAKEVDDSVMLAGFMAFWNMTYLAQEYTLAFRRRGSGTFIPPAEVKEAMKGLLKTKFNEKEITLAPVQAFIANADAVSSAWRKYLSRNVFDSPLYQANLKRHQKDEGEDDPPRIMHGFADYDVGKNVEVYVIHRGIFEFFFVEEQGRLKVLTLGFEL